MNCSICGKQFGRISIKFHEPQCKKKQLFDQLRKEREENEEKRSGFAHIIAYYMKLAYNTWHKELIPDESIRSELNTITKGQLEFTSTPFVRAYREQDDRFQKRGKGGFQQRNNRNGVGGGGKNRPQQKFGKKRFK